MHGELTSGWCLACDERFGWQGAMGEAASLPSARQVAGQVRPDIVWFGEMPYEMERIDAALMSADLFVSIGTSGAVYPAAGFVQTARYCGAQTLEINLEPSQGSMFFDERRYGPASECRSAEVGGARCCVRLRLVRPVQPDILDKARGPRPSAG